VERERARPDFYCRGHQEGLARQRRYGRFGMGQYDWHKAAIQMTLEISRETASVVFKELATTAARDLMMHEMAGA